MGNGVSPPGDSLKIPAQGQAVRVEGKARQAPVSGGAGRSVGFSALPSAEEMGTASWESLKEGLPVQKGDRTC